MTARLRPLALLAAGALSAGLLAVAPTTALAASDECVDGTQPANNNVANQAPTPADDTAEVVAGGEVVIPVLANDTDPEGDSLTVVSVSGTDRGEACVLPDGSVLFAAEAARRGYTARFYYGVSDGDRYRRALVQVAVTGLPAVKPEVRSKLKVTKAGKVTKRARLAFRNTGPVTVVVYGGVGDEESEEYEFRRTVRPGKRVVVATSTRRISYFALARTGETRTLVNYGVVNTVTGRQRAQYLGHSFGEDEGFSYVVVSSTARALLRGAR